MAVFPELMSYDEVAAYLGISKSGVRKLAHSRQIPTVSLGHKIKRIKAEDLCKFIERRTKG